MSQYKLFGRVLGCVVLSATSLVSLARGAPVIESVHAAMQQQVDECQIAGAVTLVATKDRIIHLDTVGFADIAAHRPMAVDDLFWIASMSKPVTAVAVAMLRDDGKLQFSDPVAKYIPEFAALKTPSGKPANLTIADLLDHKSGLADPRAPATRSAHTLRDLVKIYLSEPMQFEPGTTWRYTTSGFNVAGLVVEVVSRQPFEKFLETRLFAPLGMKDTTFYPSAAQQPRLVNAYRANAATHTLTLLADSGPTGPIPAAGQVPPQGGGGLYSTANDYARFCQMLLNQGTLDGHKYITQSGVQALHMVTTGNLPTGYTKTKLNHVLGWGLGFAVVVHPEGGVAGELSPGSFGHPGAYGTAAWIDPSRGVAYIMMVQRPNMPDNLENPPALAFIHAAAAALPPRS